MYLIIDEEYDCPPFVRDIPGFAADATAGWKLAFELVHGKGTFGPWFADLSPESEYPWVTLKEICRTLLDETSRTGNVLPLHLRHPIECAMVVLDTYASLSRFTVERDYNSTDYRSVEQFAQEELPAICEGAFGGMPNMLWHGLSTAHELFDPGVPFERYLAQQGDDLDVDTMNDICERALASEDYLLEALPQYTQHALALMHQACQALMTLELESAKWITFFAALRSSTVYKHNGWAGT